MAHILAVDDDHDLCTLLKTALERDGHTVETRTSGTQLTDTLCRWADCILLDVMMPGEDGFAVCRRIRAETDAPILFLTARTDEPSVLTGLGLGADDYLTKPFRVAELRARVAAHLRRQNRTPSHKITRGGVTLDLSAKEADVGGTPLHLTKSEYAICELLALHAGQTFSKEQIYEAVFGYDGTADDTAITQHIKTSAPNCARPGQGRCCKRYGEWATNGKTKTDIPAHRAAAVSPFVRRRVCTDSGTLVGHFYAADKHRFSAACRGVCPGLFRGPGDRGRRDRRNI